MLVLTLSCPAGIVSMLLLAVPLRDAGTATITTVFAGTVTSYYTRCADRLAVASL
jgi:hypothetical protein